MAGKLNVAVVTIACWSYSSALLSAVLTVSNTSDVINGNVSSPAALIASPGPDGISFREAVLACNNATGPNRIEFADSLTGATIRLVSPLSVDAPQLAIDAGPQPRVGIDVTGLPTGLGVRESHVTISGLKISGIEMGGAALRIHADDKNISVDDITIEHSEFHSTKRDGNPVAISVGMLSGTGLRVTNVTIANNLFDGVGGDGDAVHVPTSGTNSLVENLIVEDNIFQNCTFPVELVPGDGATGTHIRGTIVRHNTFLQNVQPVSIGTIAGTTRVAAANVIESTRIDSNLFIGSGNPAVIMGAGNGAMATGNSIVDTEIINNIIVGCRIQVTAGFEQARGNTIDRLRIINNTITECQSGPAIFVTAGDDTLDDITNVVVLNTILWHNLNDILGLTVPQVRFTLTSIDRFVGQNGNISGDPLFRDPTHGDYVLRDGSPAIDAGTSDGAPAFDRLGNARCDNLRVPNRGAGAAPRTDLGALEAPCSGRRRSVAK